jgi:hypothetical protein
MFRPRIDLYDHLLFFFIMPLVYNYICHPPVAAIVSAVGFYIYKLAANLAFYTFHMLVDGRSVNFSKQKNTETHDRQFALVFSSQSRIRRQGKSLILLVSCFLFMMGG